MKWLALECLGWLGIGAFGLLVALWITGELHEWGL